MMDKKPRSCKVTIFGETYALLTSQTDEHIVQAARIVDALMQEIAGSAAAMDEKKVAILTALRMASKVLTLEDELNQGKSKEKQLIEMIDRELSGNSCDIGTR